MDTNIEINYANVSSFVPKAKKVRKQPKTKIIIEKEEKVDGVNLEDFASRLQWLAEKFKNITRSSVSVGSVDESTDMNQKSIDDILKDLGL